MIYKALYRTEWGGWSFCAVQGEQVVRLQEGAYATSASCRTAMLHQLVKHSTAAWVPTPELDIRVRFLRRFRLWLGQWWRPGLLGWTDRGAQVGRRWVPIAGEASFRVDLIAEALNQRPAAEREPAYYLEER